MVKLKLTSKEILNKVFPPSDKGYDAYEVDLYLDKILSDYKLVEESALLTKEQVEKNNQKIKSLEKAKSELEIELGKYKTRFSNIKPEDNVTTDNIILIKRINALEKALYKLGVDPTTIK